MGDVTGWAGSACALTLLLYDPLPAWHGPHSLLQITQGTGSAALSRCLFHPTQGDYPLALLGLLPAIRAPYPQVHGRQGRSHGLLCEITSINN